MTPKKWSRVFDLAILIIGFGIPLFFIFSFYVSLETTTPAMTISIIGVFLGIGLLLALVKWLKRRIKNRKEMGFAVSPYTILVSNTIGGVVGIILFTWFLDTVKGEIETLFKTMLIWSVCAVIAFVLKFAQVHFDILDKQQNP